jgi:hypothetical protein
MNIEFWLTTVLVICTVWGGLVYFITRAFKYEKGKEKLGE